MYYLLDWQLSIFFFFYIAQRKRLSTIVTDDEKSKLDLAAPKLFIRPKQVHNFQVTALCSEMEMASLLSYDLS